MSVWVVTFQNRVMGIYNSKAKAEKAVRPALGKIVECGPSESMYWDGAAWVFHRDIA